MMVETSELPRSAPNPVDGAPSASEHASRGVALLAADRAMEARQALRAAVALGATDPVTVLNLALAEDRAGDRERGQTLMRCLASRLPAWDEPLLRLAESQRASGALAAAEESYRQTLERAPIRREALVALSGLLIGRGAATEARALLLRCLGRDPDQAEAWDALGQALLGTGEPRLALAAFAEAQRLAPHSPHHALHAVEAATAAALLSAEEARQDSLTRDDPLNPVPQVARAVALERLGRRDQAIDALTIATSLAPDAKLPALLLGGVLARSNRLGQAERALERAMTLDPDHPRLRNDRAAELMRMHRHAEARDLLLAQIEHYGADVTSLCNLANATVCLGWQEEAVRTARRAIALQPESTLAWRALANTLPYAPAIEPATLLDALRGCSARMPRDDLGPFTNSSDPDKRLTVGLLSGSLRTHPVGWMTIAGFEALDPARFELICLAQRAAPGDAMARRFRAISRAWIDVDTLTDTALARLGRDLGLDVLIDLGGHGDAGRLGACAHRLAPVQIKWVGMQTHSTGLPEMDWLLTDHWETPDGVEALYSERLLRLPDGYVCYSPPPYAPDVGPSPVTRNGFVTFGCFNNLAKITPAVIAAWREVLHRLPTARMVLKTHQFADPATAERVRAAFGAAADRVETRGSSGHRAFMGEYNDIDIALDPFPYSGGLTTIEALWMGVPTIALPGEIFAARHSMSHLSNVGLGDWVAESVDAYIHLAVTSAADPAALSELRARLRARVAASPLCDAPRFGGALGAALRHAWTEWCSA
jgi:predicted O-linked N-acetylglucosamine transferase (SPINDLY family)